MVLVFYFLSYLVKICVAMDILDSISTDIKVEKSHEKYYAAFRYAQCRLCGNITNFTRPLGLSLQEHGLCDTVQKLLPQINLDIADDSMICDCCLRSLLTENFCQDGLLTNGYETGEKIQNLIKTEELEIKDEYETICISDDECVAENSNTKIAVEKSSETFACDYCDYISPRWTTLQRHKIYIHKKNGELLQCDRCQYQTYNKFHLATHKVRHLGKYRYPCEYCTNGFDSKLSIYNHILNSHPEMDHLVTSKILYCEFCQYRSVFNSKMYLHKLKHTKKHAQRLKCCNCGFFTYNKQTLRQHMWRHTATKKPFVCGACKKDFIEKYKLDGHLLSRHSDNEELIATITSKIHHCDKCSYKCVRLAHFQRHTLSHKNKSRKY